MEETSQPCRLVFVCVFSEVSYGFSVKPEMYRPLAFSFLPQPHIYRKRARQRPITSPWQTSSALNSEPSKVR